MKKKAMLVALLCVMGLAALSIGNAEAGWYTCTISQAGSDWTNLVVTLSDVPTPPAAAAFTNRAFVIDATGNGTGISKAKEMYAAALTAFANSTYVYVFINNTAAGSKVYALSAKK